MGMPTFWRLIHSAVEPEFGQRHNGLGTQVVSREQRTHRNGLVDAVKILPAKLASRSRWLACSATRQMLLAISFTVSSGKRPAAFFGAQHHGIGAVEHGIGHVAHLGAGGHGSQNHAFHHLCGGDGHLVVFPCQFDHAFCRPGTAALPLHGRSPAPPMMPSLAFRMFSSSGMASARSILAIRPGRWPSVLDMFTGWRASSMSVAFLGS